MARIAQGCPARKHDRTNEPTPGTHTVNKCVIFINRSIQILKIWHIKKTQIGAKRTLSLYANLCGTPFFGFRTIKPAVNQLVAV
ncbi:hypothetical protein [Ralstonia sp.]|uniref:hypothetical protein n=1 Tax=Ralstonia sp. TaxID=54061 RepID=UPI002CDFB68C|nr:hypothetical protein [Ralstonia sp.]HWV04797.1 hypothetical protein [Ralstonia sp.]